jgi:polysaccharide deacetylase family protein (PEP-CTERM system associated)
MDFRRLLDVFDEHGVRVTCFVLGWVAERFPHLVKDAVSRGHEIASHGYGHRLVYECTEREFRDDIAKAKEILEQVSGRSVIGYRSPGFSCTEEVPWFFEALAETGHRYDSSVFPAPRGHGGIATSQLGPHTIAVNGARLIEFPISVAQVLGRRLCLFGGGYLRLFPYGLIRRMARQVLGEGRPVVFYIHPREIDPDHPRLPMPAARRFKSYVNLRTTEPKVRRILHDFRITTFRQFIADTPALAEVC